MTIHVNIGEAKTRLSELIAAAVAGEEVILDKAGEPQVRLAPVRDTEEAARAEVARRRKEALGRWKNKYAHLTEEELTVPDSMTDEELKERWQRKLG